MAGILVVDDDRVGLEIRKLILEAAGHEVKTASDPRSALQSVAEFSPDIVIVDLGLPDVKDGLALIRAVRKLAPSTRLIVVSGWDSALDGTAERAMVDEVLPKPVRSERLIRALSVRSGS